MFEHQRNTARIQTRDKKRKIAHLIIARLEGKDINKRFKYYKSLAKEGIGGFIIFGGSMQEVKDGVKKLQEEAEKPLFIASDLEQGLGQQIEGGTIFPPAMAIAKAIDPRSKNDVELLRRAIDAIAAEAKAVGINVILAPVVDVNINPRNPIICTRAFSDSPEKVAWFGNEFIKGLQRNGLIACAKHFPGHGDTTKDSHRELPVVKAEMERLNDVELYPFVRAIRLGVKMIMVGHLKVPAIDSGLPTSLSRKAIKKFLRNTMKFKGLVITDAMNMHAVSRGDEEVERRACLMALSAGANILLHPRNPEMIIDYLSAKWNKIGHEVEESLKRILKAKRGVDRVYPYLSVSSIDRKSHLKIANELTMKSLNITMSDKSRWIKMVRTDTSLKRRLTILVIDDDNCASGRPFIKTVMARYKKVKSIYIDNKYEGEVKTILNSLLDSTLIIAIFSRVSAWKGRSGLSRKLTALAKKAVMASKYSVVIGFCCPYILQDIKADSFIEAYSDSGLTQEGAAKLLCDLLDCDKF